MTNKLPKEFAAQNMADEIEKLKSHIKELSFLKETDYKMVNNRLIELEKERDRHNEKVFHAFEDIEDIKRATEEIWSDIDETDQWKMKMEEFIGVVRMERPQRDYGRSRGKKGRTRNHG